MVNLNWEFVWSENGFEIYNLEFDGCFRMEFWNLDSELNCLKTLKENWFKGIKSTFEVLTRIYIIRDGLNLKFELVQIEFDLN